MSVFRGEIFLKHFLLLDVFLIAPSFSLDIMSSALRRLFRRPGVRWAAGLPRGGDVRPPLCADATEHCGPPSNDGPSLLARGMRDGLRLGPPAALPPYYLPLGCRDLHSGRAGELSIWTPPFPSPRRRRRDKDPSTRPAPPHVCKKSLALQASRPYCAHSDTTHPHLTHPLPPPPPTDHQN